MGEFTREEYDKLERSQTLHRRFNTLLSILVVVMGFYFVQTQVRPLYEKLSGIEAQKVIQSEIAQIVADEGYRRCAYKDSLGLWTQGFGHLMTSADKDKCIDPQKAVDILRKDYTAAKVDVENRYPWAQGELKLVMINMTFNLGSARLSKFTDTLAHLEAGRYDQAAGELLDSKYANQVPNRAARMAGRIMRLQE